MFVIPLHNAAFHVGRLEAVGFEDHLREPAPVADAAVDYYRTVFVPFQLADALFELLDGQEKGVLEVAGLAPVLFPGTNIQEHRGRIGADGLFRLGGGQVTPPFLRGGIGASKQSGKDEGHGEVPFSLL